MAFSGAVRISDLNDYIAPTQACVVALNGKKLEVQGGDADLAQVQLQPKAAARNLGTSTAGAPGIGGLALPQGPGVGLGPPPQEGDAVKVTLHDCLACSGCITSAETVLLAHQSGDEFLAKLKDPGTKVVVSISAQSRTALAALYGIPPAQALSLLVGWLRSIGVAAVLDLGAARDLALLENAAEFIARFRAAQQAGKAPTAGASTDGSSAMDVDGPAPSPAAAGTSMFAQLHAGSSGQQGPGEEAPGPLPMLASACPGWVCYAEKTHGDLVLPHLARTKSPQAIMGSLVKRLLAERLGVADPAHVYHCSVMPCYDKKLEAARDELWVPGTQVPEVDSCLTTGELHELLMQHASTMSAAGQPAQLPAQSGSQGPSQASAAAAAAAQQVLARVQPCAPDVLVPELVQGDGSSLFGLPGGSGGYTNFVFRAAAAELFGQLFPPGPLPLRTLRNSDFQEVVLEAYPGGPVLLRAAIVNGFRNIQTLMRRLKMGKCEYHYAEVMACPSGCLNGGGQIKPAQGQTPQQLLEQLEQFYTHQDVTPRQPQDNPAVQALYRGWLGGGPGSPQARALLHTTYRKRENKAALLTAAAAGDW